MIAASDNYLMMRVREGDDESLGVLFERHRHRLLRFFARRTRDWSASEDLVQDVFVRIIKYRHSFRPDSEFTAWLFRIARNLHATFYHRTEQLSASCESGFSWETLMHDGPSPDESLDRRQKLDLLRRAILTLPPEKRELLQASRMEGASYRDIAQGLKCREGAVKVRVFRATRELREAFRRLSAGRCFGERLLTDLAKE